MGNIKNMPCTVKIMKCASGVRTTGLDFVFSISAIDEQGNLKNEGGDDFEVYCQTKKGEDIVVETEDLGTGMYEAYYTLRGKNLFNFDVKINGSHLSFSPFVQDLRTKAKKNTEFKRNFPFKYGIPNNNN